MTKFNCNITKCSESESVSLSIASDSLQPHGLQPVRLLCPWNSPGKNTGVGCHSFLHGIFLTQGLNLSPLHCRQILYRLSHREAQHNDKHDYFILRNCIGPSGKFVLVFKTIFPSWKSKMNLFFFHFRKDVSHKTTFTPPQ